MKGTDFMVMECTQTANQKETVKLIKDFFSSVGSRIIGAGWGTGIISKLFGITGIKFDKPFMVEVFEGSFTTNSLLKKYPINESQVMYIFTIREEHSSCNERTYYNVKSTRVYHYGKVYTNGNDDLKRREEYFDDTQLSAYKNLDDYNTYRQQATKTLVLVTNKKNVIGVKSRKTISKRECDLLQDICRDYDYSYNRYRVDYDNNAYKTHRVKLVKKEDNKYWVALRNGIGRDYIYRNSYYFEPFDKSGYCVVGFRKYLTNRLGKYRDYLKLKRVAETDYSQELQTRYDELIVLKNLISTSTINNTDSETLWVLNNLMRTTISSINSHENITKKLRNSKEAYKECEHKEIRYYPHKCYMKIDDITDDFEKLDRSIKDIRTELFDRVLQQDI